MTLFDAKGHLTQESLRAHADGALDDGQAMRVLDHICGCRDCAGRLCAELEPLTAPPRGFAQAVTLRVRQSAESKRAEYRRYCLRVALSSAAALALVLGSMFALPGRVAAKAPPEPKEIEMPAPQEIVLPEPQKTTLPEPQKNVPFSERLASFWEQITHLFQTEE